MGGSGGNAIGGLRYSEAGRDSGFVVLVTAIFFLQGKRHPIVLTVRSKSTRHNSIPLLLQNTRAIEASFSPSSKAAFLFRFDIVSEPA
jgi:hypothetical protein